MATLSPSELLDWLAQFQFLSSAQADELRPTLATFADSHVLGKELIRRNWLTPYQVNQILQGRHEQLVLGIYRLRERIGEGAMGQVFKAWNSKNDRIVAVKTLHKQMIENEKAMERFRREMATTEQLDHPNICHVSDAGEEDNRPFLVMEFIDGIDMSRRVKTQGAMPIHEAVEYARQAALGLQHALERGIVHRDIKPANLMVTTIRYNDDALPVVKILDFGLARYESEQNDGNRLTALGKMLGTIDYVSPEQATDARNADIRADIYSLGCSLFYMLTARPPFLGKDVVEKLGPRVTGDPPWIRTVREEIPPGLEAVIRKMMARLPEERYQTPLEVAQALEPFAVGPKIALAQPVQAPAAGNVALATPIASGAITTGNVALAQPMFAAPLAPPTPPEPSEASFLEMTATGRDLSSGASAAVPHAVKPHKSPLKLIAILGGGAAVVSALACLTFCLYSYWLAPKKPEGSIRITKAQYSVPSQELPPGHRKFLNVYIERDNCKGPLTILLLDLPDGVVAEPQIMPANATEFYVGVTVSNIPPLKTQIRLRVESQDGVFAEKMIPLVVAAAKN